MTAQAVRSQSARVTTHVRDGGGLFALHDERLDHCADLVVQTTRSNYPTLDIPYHSRWRHFSSPGTTLEAELASLMESADPLEAARIGFDLVIPSVLLDAGAGPDWAYLPDGATNAIGRSEGLGLASLAMFLDGAFATDGQTQTHAAALSTLSNASLCSGFQVADDNPLVGVEGRLLVLQSLGNAMTDRPEVFPTGRPGDLVDQLLHDDSESVAASAILGLLLDVLAPIWPSRLERDGIRLGDAWVYAPFAADGDDLASIVPFHKLSQWLSYSLVETLQRSGIEVTGLDQLTGLPEYRNGGLLLESGVLSLRNPDHAKLSHQPGSQLIVEWRACTITLLDEVAALVRTQLDRPDMPLAEILEGGTWAAGRKLAFARDPAGTPPLRLESDGTVF